MKQQKQTPTKIISIIVSLILIFSAIIFFSNFVNAQGLTTAEQVGSLEPTVCCEKTKGGLFCQDVPEEQCADGARALPTACSSSSFCKSGFCSDPLEGICLDNTPQIVCNENEGTWFAEQPPQCGLGCCVLGDQASFVTLTRCKRLSGFLGLETNYNAEITGEAQCLLTARAEEKGACVFEEEFEKTCKLTTRSECTSDRILGTSSSQSQSTPQQDEESSTGEQTTDSGLTPAPVEETQQTTGNNPATEEATTKNIEIRSFALSTSAVTIKTGDTVTWTNRDSEIHTVSSVGVGELNSGSLTLGQSYSHTFENEGTFNYFCETHPDVADLKGTVTVENVQAPITGQAVGDEQNPYPAPETEPTETPTENPAQTDSQNPQNAVVKFYPGILCSAEELGTNCGPTQQTTCLPGKEEVYFVDTCGNPANIYDSSKANTAEYWSEIKDKSESCNPNSANQNSVSCGNCNYLEGSYCREATSETANPTYGENVCADLNCVDDEGKGRRHGESWCEYDGGDNGKVGSRYYRQICINGDVVVEPCADFRQEECIENENNNGFSEAACRVNRWQDCTIQKEKAKCENFDKRDCKWLDGIEYVLISSIAGTSNGTTYQGNSLDALKKAVKDAGGLKNLPRGACVPLNPPGLNFWSGEEAAGVCAQANAACPVVYEKKLLGGDWKCVEHCECLPGGELEKKRVELCTSLGDCGPKINFVGQKGSGKGYETTQQEKDKKK